MVRHQNNRSFADIQFGSIHALGFEFVEFLYKFVGVDDHARTGERFTAFLEYAAGYQMQLERTGVVDDGVSRVVSALKAHHHIHLIGQIIYDFAFTFVAELRAYKYSD